MSEPITDWDDIVHLDPPVLRDIGPVAPEAVFCGEARSEAAFGGEAGLLQGPSFTPAEIAHVRALIVAQLVENARKFSPQTADAIAGAPLELYHEAVTSPEHGKLLSKLGRILPAAAVDEIRQMSFFDYVRGAFGPYYLSDEENIGHEQICFRVVRPNMRTDVGTLHQDSWFWDHFGFLVPEGVNRTKVWVPVCGAPEKSGLFLARGSHRRPSSFQTKMVDGKLAFIPEIDPETLDLHRFLGHSGEPILFNYKTLHTGALNRGPESRISFEITIMYRAAHY